MCVCVYLLAPARSHKVTVSLMLPFSSLPPSLSWIHICKDYVNQYCTAIDSSFRSFGVSRHNTNYYFPQRREEGSADGCDRALRLGPANWILMIQVSFLEHLFKPPVEI